MKLGATQYTLAADGTGWLEAAARLGLAGAEPYIGDPGDFLMQAGDAEIAAVARHARSLSVAIPSVALGIFNTYSAIVDPDAFDEAVAIVRRGLDLTARLGAGTMLLCTFLVSHPDTPRRREQLLKVIRAVTPHAASANITIALEAPNPAAEMLKLVDVIDSPHFRIYYDLGNAIAMSHDASEEIQQLGKRIVAIHIKDSVREQLGSRHLGDGDLHLSHAMKAIDAIGFEGWLLLETPGGDEARLRDEIATVRSLMKTHQVRGVGRQTPVASV